ncbi:cytidine deaminase [Ekhidna sp.]
MSLEELKEKAIKASANAYAPYSKFKVGCVLITSTGNIYTGCNVENASYGLTTCAERNAISNAINAEGTIEIDKIIVFTPTPTPTPPCGACRQVINEFGNPEIRSYCEGGDFSIYQSDDLLPHAFKLKES